MSQTKRNIEKISLDRLKNEVQLNKEQIRNTFHQLRENLNRREQLLIEELDDIYDRTEFNLNERDRKLACLDDCKDRVVNIRSNQLRDVVYQSLVPISKEMEKLQDQCILAPAIKLEFSLKLLQEIEQLGEVNINIPPYTERIYPEWLTVEKGSSEHEMEEPFSVLSISTNELLVSDRKKNVIKVYNETGEYTSTIRDKNLVRPLYMCAHGNAFFVTCGVESGKVLKFVKKQNGIWELVQLQHLEQPIAGLNVDEHGILYVFQTKERKIFALHASNLEIITQVELKTENFVQGRTRIMDAKIHNSEWYVLFTNSEYSIQCFNKNGQLKRTVVDSRQFKGGLHFCIDNIGNIIGSEGLSDQVKVFSNEGKYITNIGSNGDFTNPRGVALDHKGRVIVCDLKMCDMLSCY